VGEEQGCGGASGIKRGNKKVFVGTGLVLAWKENASDPLHWERSAQRERRFGNE